MNKNQKLLNNKSGYTLVEILVAMVISAIIVWAIANAFLSFTRTNIMLREGVKLQENFARANQIIERDVRKAGFNLPGNGIHLDTNLNSIYIISNEEGRQTKLHVNAYKTHKYVIVEDDCGVDSGEWVCLNLDECVYIQIDSIIRGSVADTIMLDTSVQLERDWDKASTEVYFATGFSYLLETDPNSQTKSFVRKNHKKTYVISTNIEILIFVFKDVDGNVLEDEDFQNAITVLIRLGKNLKGMLGVKEKYSEIEINIRNYK